ncbi:MAG: hypothetical protein KDD55_11845 [Bdellovibrionales bacterium]|nr:hypothetical protein [Bdellovibrionales bacterium]
MKIKNCLFLSLSLVFCAATSASALSHNECYQRAEEWGHQEALNCIEDNADSNGDISADTLEACMDFGAQVEEMGREACDNYFESLRRQLATSPAGNASPSLL